jgi:hypothetical protein
MIRVDGGEHPGPLRSRGSAHPIARRRLPTTEGATMRLRLPWGRRARTAVLAAALERDDRERQPAYARLAQLAEWDSSVEPPVEKQAGW